MTLIPRRIITEEDRKRILEELQSESSDDGNTPGTLYSDVVFEAQALYGGTEKKLLSYDQSLTRLLAARQTRHPRPREVFSLLIANLENKLTSVEKAVADDMLNSHGEWLSAAMKRHGTKLTVYEDPQGLIRDGSAYIQQNFKFSSKREFNLSSDLPSQQYVDLNQFGADLVHHLYSRPFSQLPKEMREGSKRAQLYLPANETISPVGRSYFGSFIISSFSYDSTASRGVVPRAKT